jgi:hypothetical protein
MGTHGRSTLFLVSALAAIAVAAACSPPRENNPGVGARFTGPVIRSFSITGRGAFADGSAVSSTNIQFQLIVDGSNMFQAGVDGCLPTPAHVAATVIQGGSTGSKGQYSLNVPVETLRAAVVRQCSIQQLQTGQVSKLILRATLLAKIPVRSFALLQTIQAPPASKIASRAIARSMRRKARLPRK